MAELAERVDAELEQIDQSLALLPQADDVLRLDSLELAGAGAALHSFYNGMENILKQALDSLDVSWPTGDSCHKELIQEAVKAGVISQETASGIRQYLAFRHFFRHAYAIHLDPEQLLPLVQDVSEACAHFKNDLAVFLASRRSSSS